MSIGFLFGWFVLGGRPGQWETLGIFGEKDQPQCAATSLSHKWVHPVFLAPVHSRAAHTNPHKSSGVTFTCGAHSVQLNNNPPDNEFIKPDSKLMH